MQSLRGAGPEQGVGRGSGGQGAGGAGELGVVSQEAHCGGQRVSKRVLVRLRCFAF